jgi:hypothetical protein
MNTLSCLVVVTKQCALADSSACVIRQVRKVYFNMQLTSKILSLQFDKVVPLHTKKAYERSGAKASDILNAALNAGEWSLSLCDHCTPTDEAPLLTEWVKAPARNSGSQKKAFPVLETEP